MTKQIAVHYIGICINNNNSLDKLNHLGGVYYYYILTTFWIFVISCYIFMQMLSSFNFWNDVKAYNTNRFDIFFVVIQHSRIETMLVGFKEEIEFWNLIGLSYPSPIHVFKTRVGVHSFKYRYEYREQIGTKHRIAISAYISRIRGHFS